MPATTQIGIPESMRLEHAEIHDELVRATKLPGRIGDAARELATILHPHFHRSGSSCRWRAASRPPRCATCSR